MADQYNDHPWIPVKGVTITDCSIAFKFKVSDKVKNIKTKAKGSVVTRLLDNSANPQYRIDYDEPWHGSTFEKEEDLELCESLTYTGHANKTCTCGSLITYGPQTGHSHYCDMFVPYDTGDKS